MRAVNSNDTDVFDNHILYNFLYKALLKRHRCAGGCGNHAGDEQGADQEDRVAFRQIWFRRVSWRSWIVSWIIRRRCARPGIAYATDQIIDLIANGVNHVHIYTMNKPDVAGEILDNLSEI